MFLYLRRPLLPGSRNWPEAWADASKICTKQNRTSQLITVNSSKAAVPVYSALGFKVAGAYEVKNGIGFVPMTYAIS